MYAPEERIQRLCKALERMVDRMDGLERLGAKGREGERCALRLSSARGPVAVLRVSEGRVSVTTRSAGLNAEAGDTKIVDDLRVDLTNGFSWNDVLCDSAEELAGLLVKHMVRRTRHADPEPEGAESSESATADADSSP